MKKKTFLLFLLFVTSCVARAEIVHWTIPPHFDEIRLSNEKNYVRTDSSDWKSIWTYDGKLVYSTNADLWSIQERHVVATHPGTSITTEFCNLKGKVVKIDSARVMHNYPYFSDGNLLVKFNDVCFYVDTLGNASCKNLLIRDAYPYSHGLSSIVRYRVDDPEKGKLRAPYFQYIDSEYNLVEFTLNNKKIDIEDVSFLSSICDEGFGIAIIDSKLYRYDIQTKELVPYCHMHDSLAQKQKPFNCERSFKTQANDTTYFLLNSKKGKAALAVDQLNKPVYLRYQGLDTCIVFQKNEQPALYFEPLIESFGDLGGYGFTTISGDTLLPAQFYDVKTYFKDYAIVQLHNGKWGLLNVDWDSDFLFRVNDGDPITFHHRNMKNEVRIDVPLYISADQTTFEIDSNSGLTIDPSSRRIQDTKEGHYTTYKCNIHLSENLPDTMTVISYPVVVTYENIRSRELRFGVEERYSKYFSVEPNHNTIATFGDSITFEFDIDTKTMDLNDIGVMTVTVMGDSLNTGHISHSAYKYTAKVGGLKEGVNQVVIRVVEQGCPAADFPFNINYSKPKTSKGKSDEPAQVNITKKEVHQKRSQRVEMLEFD